MPRKRFGQHFLHERGIINRILHALAPSSQENLVEIGPGKGALTLPLLRLSFPLSIIEVDHDLLKRWQDYALTCQHLDVIPGDALKVDYTALAERFGGSMRLIGNLPYNISTPILFTLLCHAACITDMHFMLQKEVVDRLTAPPGNKQYGRLSVTIAARAQCHKLFDVSPGAFSPPPRVMSAVVRITPRAPAFPIQDSAVFDRVVTAAFNQRRKTIRNTLKPFLDTDAIEQCGINPGSRAEQLPPSSFARLANHVADSR